MSIWRMYCVFCQLKQGDRTMNVRFYTRYSLKRPLSLWEKVIRCLSH